MTRNEHNPGHLARRFQQIAVAVFHAEVERLGYDLTPVQYAALVEIEAEQDIDQATLASVIAYDRTTTSGVVDRLFRKGLVTRHIGQSDRRARQLRITEQGIATLRAVEPAVANAQAMLTSGLTAKEAEQLTGLLLKAIAAANEHSRAPMRREKSIGLILARHLSNPD